MNIHIFINCYWGSGISGGDRRILEIMRRWKDTEHYKFIVYTTQEFYDLMVRENIMHLTVNIINQGKKENSNIVIEYAKRTCYCIKVLKTTICDGDVLYSPTDILPDVIPAAYYKVLRRKSVRWCIITHHVYEVFYKRPGNLFSNFLSCYQQKYALYLGKHYSDVFLTPSPVVYDYMCQHKYAMNKVRMIDNAVDKHIIDNANESVEEYEACFLARLNYSKGIFELPIIWNKVIERFPNARLAIIGKGTDEIVEQLKEVVRANYLENNVIILGYLEADKAYSIMKKSKLFLFTSHEEGWGIAVAEALVCGIPVVAYDLPVFERVFKEGICLCKFKDTDEMAKSVCNILEDDNMRVKMGLAGREFILSHYSLDKIAKNELEILLQNGSDE